MPLEAISFRRSLSVGHPLRRGGLSLFPVYSTQPPAPTYLASPAAERAGVLTVDEVPGGAEVPELVVSTTSGEPVLLVEGEIVAGNQQDRTLNVSVLARPAAATAVPVSCVEAGRWGDTRRGRRAPGHAPTSLRLSKSASVARSLRAGTGRRSDQVTVWADVDRQLQAFDATASAPTRSLLAAHEAGRRRWGPHFDGITPLPGQVGVVVGVAGSIRSIELFDKAATLAEYWEGLVGGFILEARPGRSTASADDALKLIAELDRLPFDRSPGAGLGTELHAAGGPTVCTGLEWQGRVVHLAAFAC